ncbi:hypothetical protein TIFTF001_021026 [Ficus carica]|uniref:DNA-directed RNA polymerase n=1 Tax=Ficus carica TaxID=3494 RepID=A0AA88ABV4_FICCA|nr:hypothetical protein TIFTF001_021026 [Ficus carica]
MQRQAVPLSRSEKCIVGTGLECQVALDSGAPTIAEHEGKIIYTDTEKIILSGNRDTLSIPLVIYQRSNKNTCMHQKPQVAQGSRFDFDRYGLVPRSSPRQADLILTAGTVTMKGWAFYQRADDFKADSPFIR